jgi:PadR family transcriptional regulator AphA
MSLPHVLLGLLAPQPSTGYDLERTLRVELDPIWRAEFSQIYPELARLRRAGFVVMRVLGPRRGPRRNRYRVTAAGRRELKRWLAEPSALARGRDEVLVRIALLDGVPAAERREAISRQERAVAEEIARLRTAPAPQGFRREARRGALEKLEATRRWLKALSHETPPVTAAAPASKKR